MDNTWHELPNIPFFNKNDFLTHFFSCINSPKTEKQEFTRHLERQFAKSNEVLDTQIQIHQIDIYRILQTFKRTPERIANMMSKTDSVKNKVFSCQKSLIKNMSHIKNLWMSELELNETLKILTSVERVVETNSRLEECLLNGRYLQATSMILSCQALLSCQLKPLEVMETIKENIQIQKDNLFNLIINELQQHIYEHPSKEVLFRFKLSLPNQDIDLPNGLVTIKSAPAGEIGVSARIDMLLKAIESLGRSNEASKRLREACGEHLRAVVWRAPPQFLNICLKPNAANFVDLVLQQFEAVASRHQSVLSQIDKNETKSKTDYMRLYTQPLTEAMLESYLTVRDRYMFSNSGEVKKIVPRDLNHFFHRKSFHHQALKYNRRFHSCRSSETLLFRFDHSAHAQCIRNYQSENRKELIEEGEFPSCAEFDAFLTLLSKL